MNSTSFPPPDGVVMLPGETPLQTYQRYFADYHSPDRDKVLADLGVWVNAAVISYGPPPASVVQNPGETPQETQARYVADYHSPDRDQVLAAIAVWVSNPVLLNAGPPPDGVVQNTPEPPPDTLARYEADYHSPDRDKVLADLAVWAKGKSVPPVPSRVEACSIQTPFQGFYIWSKTFSADYQKQYGGNGQIPFFGSAYLDFIAAGDAPEDLLSQFTPDFTHVMLYLGRNGRGYDEEGQPYGDDRLIPYYDAANNLDWFVQQTDIVIQSGKKPQFVIDGEGDPSFIRANFERFVAALRVGYDRTKYGPFTVAFDSVWPQGAGWTPEVVVETIEWMRSVLGPDGYLFFWYGNGPANYPYLYVLTEGDYSDQRFDGLDGVLTTSGLGEALGVSMANKAQYMVLNPDYTQFQPSFKGHFIMLPNSRGQRFWGNIEWATYQTVRDPNQDYKVRTATERQQMRTMNVPCAG